MIDINMISCKKKYDPERQYAKKCEYRYGSVFKQLSNPLQSWPADLYDWPEILTWLVTCDDKAYQ